MTPADRFVALILAAGALVGTWYLLTWADVPTGTFAKIVGAVVVARIGVWAITAAISNGEDKK